MSEPRPLEIRVAEKEEQMRKAFEKAEQYKAQLKQLQIRKADEERKERTHKLIVCGAELAALYGRPLEAPEIKAMVDFLRQMKETGQFTVCNEENQTEAAEPVEIENLKPAEKDDGSHYIFNF